MPFCEFEFMQCHSLFTVTWWEAVQTVLGVLVVHVIRTIPSSYQLKTRKGDSTSILTQSKTLYSGVSSMFVSPLMSFVKPSNQYFHNSPNAYMFLGRNQRADLYHRIRMMHWASVLRMGKLCWVGRRWNFRPRAKGGP